MFEFLFLLVYLWPGSLLVAVGGHGGGRVPVGRADAEADDEAGDDEQRDAAEAADQSPGQDGPVVLGGGAGGVAGGGGVAKAGVTGASTFGQRPLGGRLSVGGKNIIIIMLLI